MGLLFRKRLRLSKWLSVNVSKSGLGLSVGPPGAKISVNPKRARVQLGIPGTGLGYRKDMSLPQQERPTTPARHHAGRWILLGVLALLLAMWWLSGCVATPAGYVGSGGQPPQTIELYDAAGRRVGYGKVQGGTVELFNHDSSRAGSGKVGR